MRTAEPITISLPANILRETERIAKEEVCTRTDVIRDALNQCVASRRWQRLRSFFDSFPLTPALSRRGARGFGYRAVEADNRWKLSTDEGIHTWMTEGEQLSEEACVT